MDSFCFPFQLIRMKAHPWKMHIFNLHLPSSWAQALRLPSSCPGSQAPRFCYLHKSHSFTPVAGTSVCRHTCTYINLHAIDLCGNHPYTLTLFSNSSPRCLMHRHMQHMLYYWFRSLNLSIVQLRPHSPCSSCHGPLVPEVAVVVSGCSWIISHQSWTGSGRI